ncbi:hypothetical protein WDV91_08040 [Curtobacterium flaccumfaciens pv. flaccumfaciens]
MPRPTPARPRSVDRRTAVLAALTLVAFGVAATARVLVDVTTSAAASPARYATAAIAPRVVERLRHRERHRRRRGQLRRCRGAAVRRRTGVGGAA